MRNWGVIGQPRHRGYHKERTHMLLHLPEPIHHKISRTSFKQASIVVQQTGDARQVDQLTRPSVSYPWSQYSVHRVAWTAVSFWRRLCPLLGAILNDDDKMHIDNTNTHLTNMFLDHLAMQYQNATILDFIEAKMIEVVKARAIRRAKLQSNHYHQRTNTHI